MLRCRLNGMDQDRGRWIVTLCNRAYRGMRVHHPSHHGANNDNGEQHKNAHSVMLSHAE